MKNIQLLIGLVLLCQIFFSSCEKPAEIPATFYDCNYANFVDNSSNHPMNDQFQSILEEGQRMNIAGDFDVGERSKWNLDGRCRESRYR